MAGSSRSYRFYEFDWSRSAKQTRPLQPEIEFNVFSPSLKRLRLGNSGSLLLYWFWYLFSARGFKIYYFSMGDRVIHLSHVISRNPKFPFLGPDDFEIGPCWTDPEFRGMGLYPNMLHRITGDLRGKVERLMIFAEADNEASLKGISKAGFLPVGQGKKVGLMGRYVIDDDHREKGQ
jgi:RimJ/RimL family protein N-acetyltransferase